MWDTIESDPVPNLSSKLVLTWNRVSSPRLLKPLVSRMFKSKRSGILKENPSVGLSISRRKVIADFLETKAKSTALSFFSNTTHHRVSPPTSPPEEQSIMILGNKSSLLNRYDFLYHAAYERYYKMHAKRKLFFSSF